jgi:hypothetical protein
MSNARPSLERTGSCSPCPSLAGSLGAVAFARASMGRIVDE